MNAKTTIRLAAALVVALGLSACWDDDDDDAAPQAALEVPDSAGTSSAAFVSYIQALDKSDEGSEPLIIKGSFAVPPDDDSEPIPLT